VLNSLTPEKPSAPSNAGMDDDKQQRQKKMGGHLAAHSATPELLQLLNS
jgi:hypothetical protein